MGSEYSFRRAGKHYPFLEYYQVGGDSQSDEADFEPKKRSKEKELKNENSHSLFGVIWQIATATGWDIEYILWHINYQTLRMMLSDAPRYGIDTNIDKKKTGKRSKTRIKPGDTASFFQSRLKDINNEK